MQMAARLAWESDKGGVTEEIRTEYSVSLSVQGPRSVYLGDENGPPSQVSLKKNSFP